VQAKPAPLSWVYGVGIMQMNSNFYQTTPNISREKAREFYQKGLKVIGLKIKTEDGKLNKQDLVLGLRCVLQNFHNE
jgi:hypothetical protein